MKTAYQIGLVLLSFFFAALEAILLTSLGLLLILPFVPYYWALDGREYSLVEAVSSIAVALLALVLGGLAIWRVTRKEN
jgi:hypothetical protein